MSEPAARNGTGPGSGRASPETTPAQAAEQEAGPGPALAEAGGGSGAPADEDFAAVASDLRSQLAEAQDLRLRALADVENVRRRCAERIGRAEAEAKAAVAAAWLPVVDNLDRALQHSGADPDAIVAGVRAVRDQALGILAALGFPRREDEGVPFDPARHDAVATRPDNAAAPGSVIEVTRPAYGEGDHQLRPAQVVVARAG
jgi:molecular chaperone GrpE